MFGGLLALAAMTAGCATTTSNKPQQNWDGLQLVPSKGVDAVYLLPGVQIKTYNSVLLDPVQVAFDKNWDPNDSTRDISRHLSTKDIEEIRTEMATEFRKVFAKELSAGGYTVVEQTAPDTLRVSAGLANVYITAPDTMSAGRSYTLTNESGRMTLVMELRDGATGQLLGRVVDQKIGDNFGRMQVTNSVTNSADFRAAVSDWAKRLKNGLDRVRAGTFPPVTPVPPAASPPAAPASTG
jgi:hypothetical protein